MQSVYALYTKAVNQVVQMSMNTHKQEQHMLLPMPTAYQKHPIYISLYVNDNDEFHKGQMYNFHPCASMHEGNMVITSVRCDS